MSQPSVSRVSTLDGMGDLGWRLTDLVRAFALPPPLVATLVDVAQCEGLGDATSGFCAAIDALVSTRAVPLAALLVRLQLQDGVEAALVSSGRPGTLVDGVLALEAMQAPDPEAKAAALAQGATPHLVDVRKEANPSRAPEEVLMGEEDDSKGVAHAVKLEVAALRACLQLVQLRSQTSPSSMHAEVVETVSPSDVTLSSVVLPTSPPALRTPSNVDKGALRQKCSSLRERERALVAARAALARREDEHTRREAKLQAVASANERKSAQLRARESRVLAAERELGLGITDIDTTRNQSEPTARHQLGARNTDSSGRE